MPPLWYLSCPPCDIEKINLVLQESKFNARVRQAGYAHIGDNRIHRSTKYVSKGNTTC